jgi:phosphomannomutase/phosphoglucomutase
MIPWLLVAALMSVSGKKFSQLVDERMAAYPCSGEINYKVEDVKSIIAKILEHYTPSCSNIDKTDGISLEFAEWRFNLRGSNTEPLLRLNVESRRDPALVAAKVKEIEALINGK